MSICQSLPIGSGRASAGRPPTTRCGLGCFLGEWVHSSSICRFIALTVLIPFLAFAQEHALVPPGFKGRPVQSEKQFVADWARENGWADSDELLGSYLRPLRSLKDPKLGDFRLCRLANPALPGGGEQTLVLVCSRGRKLAVFSPLATQMRAGNQSGQTVTPAKMRFTNTKPGKILWIEISDKIQENLRGGDSVVISSRLMGYAFALARDSIRCIAYGIPIRLTMEVNGLRNESILAVSFPRRDRVLIHKSSSAVTPEQQKWIGEYNTEE